MMFTLSASFSAQENQKIGQHLPIRARPHRRRSHLRLTCTTIFFLLTSIPVHQHVNTMFGVLDAATGSVNGSRPRTLADRACDQCKLKKVRCSAGNPCARCTDRGQACSYDRARKKRGPRSRRLSIQHLHQRGSTVETSSDAESPVMQGLERISTAPSSSSNLSLTSDITIQEASSLQNSGTFSPPEFAPIEQDVQNLVSATTPRSSVNGLYTHPEELLSGTENYIFPSLPAESPSSTVDPFAGITQQDLPPLPAPDIWPVSVNETTLLPWIDVYFKRLHPTLPILSRSSLYCDMLMRKHRTDPQYGAMLLGLSAFAMTQPVQIHERASMPSRSVQARMLMEECVKMRVDASFGENPTIEMVLASFFLFACLFGSHEHKAARHRLREAVDLAYSLGLHLADSYTALETEVREQWLRTYLVLSVTERAYALQQNHPINFRGRPGITARFMHAFGPKTNEYISSLIYQEQSDSVSMTALLYLMDTFDAIDESVMDCWNGYCSFSDGICETLDRRRALQMFRAQHRVRDACISGNISFAPGVTPMPLAQLLESQRADITVTQYWVLNRLWQLCLSHHLLREASDHAELRFDFACRITQAMLQDCARLTLSSMEVHGVGFAEKLCDIAVGVVTALNASTHMSLDLTLPPLDGAINGPWNDESTAPMTVRHLLEKSRTLLRDFRGGDHQYVERLEMMLSLLPNF